MFLDISIFIFLFSSHEIPTFHRTTCLYKGKINAEYIERINRTCLEINWNGIESNLNSIKASQLFLPKITPAYEAFFSNKKQMWTRDLQSPWIIAWLWISLGYKSLPKLSEAYSKHLSRTEIKQKWHCLFEAVKNNFILK